MSLSKFFVSLCEFHHVVSSITVHSFIYLYIITLVLYSLHYSFIQLSKPQALINKVCFVHSCKTTTWYETYSSYQFCEYRLDWLSAAYARDGEQGAGGALEQSSGRKYLRYWSKRYGYTKS